VGSFSNSSLQRTPRAGVARAFGSLYLRCSRDRCGLRRAALRCSLRRQIAFHLPAVRGHGFYGLELSQRKLANYRVARQHYSRSFYSFPACLSRTRIRLPTLQLGALRSTNHRFHSDSALPWHAIFRPDQRFFNVARSPRFLAEEAPSRYWYWSRRWAETHPSIFRAGLVISTPVVGCRDLRLNLCDHGWDRIFHHPRCQILLGARHL